MILKTLQLDTYIQIAVFFSNYSAKEWNAAPSNIMPCNSIESFQKTKQISDKPLANNHHQTTMRTGVMFTKGIICQFYNRNRKPLEALELWASTWGMKFNTKKCYLMNKTRTRNHLTHNYSLNNYILQTVTREKYLGITISNDNKLVSP